jgi:hypothetical protein
VKWCVSRSVLESIFSKIIKIIFDFFKAKQTAMVKKSLDHTHYPSKKLWRRCSLLQQGTQHSASFSILPHDVMS